MASVSLGVSWCLILAVLSLYSLRMSPWHPAAAVVVACVSPCVFGLSLSRIS